MIVAMLLAAATPTTALDAEQAFFEDAQKLGQWSAFRKWAASDGLMFVPQPVNAQEWLKDRKDPPEAVKWWASHSFVSCDHSFAVNVGPWTREGGTRHGYFTTVWRRQADGWRWTYDAGDGLPKPRTMPSKPVQRVASCEGTPAARPSAPAPENAKAGTGASRDGTLQWSWLVMPDGSRSFRAFLWNGQSFEQVVADTVTAG